MKANFKNRADLAKSARLNLPENKILKFFWDYVGMYYRGYIYLYIVSVINLSAIPAKIIL